jgi:hypothetical protein
MQRNRSRLGNHALGRWPAIELEDELLAVDVVHLDADLSETECRDDRE